MPDSESRVRYFPISFFTMIMGLAGFTLVLQRATRIWNIPALIGETALYLTVSTFIVLSLLYAVKIYRFGIDVLAEFRHPVQVSFFPTFSISLILLSAGFLEVNTEISRSPWFIGIVMHLVLTLMVLSAWINRTTLEIQHTNPAWFIPSVGSLLVPIAGVSLSSIEVSWFFYSVGLVFWLVLLAIIFNRIIFHHPLPERLLPTFFILIAPPAAGFLAYSRLVGGIGPFGRILYYTALFLALLLATQWRMFFRLRFFISWWACSFPFAALTLATMVMYQLTGSDFMKLLAAALAIVLAAVIAGLLWLTVQASRRNEICTPDA